MTAVRPKHRWFHVTPDKCLVAMFIVEAFLLLSEQFHWFAFNEHRGWTVLVAVGSVGVTLVLMLAWFVAALIFQRPFQFDIRSLLALVLAVAIPFSWLAVARERARKQSKVAARIENANGDVGYGEVRYKKGQTQARIPEWLLGLLGDDFFTPVTSVSLNGTDITEAMLEDLHCLPELHDLNLKVTNVGDAELKHIEGITSLRTLILNSTRVTDVGLKHVACLAKLRDLELERDHVTDAGLANLKGMGDLQVLNLGFTKITDAGLEHLKGLAQLEALNLESTNITDAGLEHVESLKGLKFLGLRGTKVTDAGLKHVNRLTELEELSLPWTGVTAAGLRQLKGLRRLDDLSPHPEELPR